PGKHYHDEEDGFHFCDTKCQFCECFVRVIQLPHGHTQLHDNKHGNMIPNQFSDDEEYAGYKLINQGKFVPCNLYCKDLGRHRHVDYCQNEKACKSGQDIQLINKSAGDVERTTIGCFANRLNNEQTYSQEFFNQVHFRYDWFLPWQLGKISKKPKIDGEHSMRITHDSLASTDYSDKHKLLMVIADGDITGSDNDKTTPEIYEDLIEPFNYLVSSLRYHKSYLAIGETGTPEERKGLKAGNRGKRDSQLILTIVLVRCVASMERDPTVMGLCGETKIANMKTSWNIIYTSHYLGKSYESIFGGVTCLSGYSCIVSSTWILRTLSKRKMIYVPKVICKTIVPDEFKVLLSQKKKMDYLYDT
ncbi:7062_t:CDS:2, partial [Funneliformis caledonium]